MHGRGGAIQELVKGVVRTFSAPLSLAHQKYIKRP